MDIRYYIDPETELPHLYRHGVAEQEVEEVLRRPDSLFVVTVYQLDPKALRALRRRRRRKR